MAGQGLIWAGIGQGIANAGSTMANIGVRDYEMREAARLRSADKEEDRIWREEQKNLDRDRQDERDRMYRKTVEQQIAGGKGTGGMKGVDPADLEPGGKLAHLIAGEAGMTAPDYAKQINAMKTGDMSGYETIVGARADEEGPSPIKALPEGFKKEFDAKAKMLSQLAMTYVTGSEAKGIAEAKQIGLITNAAEGVLSGTGDVTRAYQAGGIVKGNDRFKEGGGVVVETATGANKATPVGESQIAENTAQAGAAKALASERTATLPKLAEEVKKIKAETEKITKETGQVGVDKPSHDKLGQIMNSAKDWLKLLDEGPHDKDYAADRAKAQALLRDTAALLQMGVATKAGNAEAPPAAATSGTRPVANDGIPSVTYEEAKKLKSGTRFRIKDTNEIRTKN